VSKCAALPETLRAQIARTFDPPHHTRRQHEAGAAHAAGRATRTVDRTPRRTRQLEDRRRYLLRHSEGQKTRHRKRLVDAS
jgi:predicted metal-dependent hydrolase